MGCVSSKPDINDQHPNIFQVTNVNDQGDLVSPGQLEVTETELVLYQRGKQPTIWPLRSLRKYGFDLEIFSFECGRRCPTGQGIYAFRCRKAEQLFNIVQQHIVRNSADENNPLGMLASDLGRRPEGYLNPRPPLSRPGSVTSNGPLSPPPAEERNNNKRGSVEYANLGSPLEAAAAPESPCHLYMNVDTKAEECEPEGHCYANVDAKDLERLRPLLRGGVETPSVPQTPTYLTVHEVNYAELDLEANRAEAAAAPAVTTLAPDASPVKAKKSYATIDFEKTNALSQSINPPMEVEEGSRKTRHNSTISDVTARHSNSLSD